MIGEVSPAPSMQPNIVIPIAGLGQRFVHAGFRLPKPLIEVAPGKPMARVVIENLGLRGKYHFLCLQKHLDEQPLASVLSLVCETRGFGVPVIRAVPQVTKGQASSVMEVLASILDGADLLAPCIVANCDQFLDAWHPTSFMSYIERQDPDGAILTFRGKDPKWSFCDVEPEGNRVLRVAEKQPISDRANVGVFYTRTTLGLRVAIENMMKDDANRCNGEWYVAPAFNEIIKVGGVVIEYPVAKMWGLGTPEDLALFQLQVKAGKVRL